MRCAAILLLAGGGYRFGAVIINAVHFVPQSRPRLFIIGVRKSSPVPRALIADGPEGEWHPSALVEAYGKLSKRSQSSWMWWRLPAPPARTSIFADLVEDEPHGVAWHTAAETKKLLGMMNPHNLAKVAAAKKAGGRVVGTIYKRTRADGPNGAYVLRVALRRSLLRYGLLLSVTTCSPLHSPDCFSGPIRSRCQASMTRLAAG